jgi:hypothetical protein
LVSIFRSQSKEIAQIHNVGRKLEIPRFSFWENVESRSVPHMKILESPVSYLHCGFVQFPLIAI